MVERKRKKEFSIRKRDTAGNRERKPLKKSYVAVSIVAAIFLAALYFAIFFLSGQDGETSGSLSHRITEVIVEQIGRIAGRSWTVEIRNSLVSYWEHPIRKLAHFSEYAVMGILVYAMWRPWRERGRKFYGFVILWVFISAALDEGHQLFVAGRYGSFLDVLLDTSGGCFGVFLSVLAEKIFGGRGRSARRKA